MCYHISNTKPARKLEDFFDVKFNKDVVYEPNYHLNGFDNRFVYIIPQENESAVIEPAKWGLLPENLENPVDFKKRFNTLNAKSESLFTSNLWKEPIVNRRCLILADGFFESKHVGKNKYPHYIRLKNHDPFAFAGIYNDHQNGVFSCSIITKKANPFMAEIHNSKERMPLILDTSFQKEWINPSLSKNSINEIIEKGFMTKEFEAYTVSKDVTNSRKNSNTIDILKPFYYPELNTLF
ncbi:Putative SOS response-associated peptidase YedK [Polaribacter sp. KT25b]|uniref:SOS response-associated peptidase n=1 Tax=Polaribacter sp. KT25b TaxID=1855336 RepID=UPI00087D9B39|nr:SOS response-associated peptidase [Polaribacter sp. KT25b]SDS09943.1 Putative SOS response-associated peptidase YedK [Polaribacter sp. KT25b]